MAHSGPEHEIMNKWVTALHSSQSVKAVDGHNTGLCCEKVNLFGVLLSGVVPGFVTDLIPAASQFTSHIS